MTATGRPSLRHPRSLIVILLLPLLVVGVGMWALTGRLDKLDEVPAAVVNLDEGTVMEVDGVEQTVPLGRALAGALTQPGTASATDDSDVSDDEVSSMLDGAGFDWRLTTEEDAEAGLKDGTYAAVVVIPADFSEDLASIGSTDAVQARIEVRTNDASGALEGAIGSAVGSAAASSMGTTFTEQYLDGIYVGFNDLQESFSEAADGAQDLADGASDLSDGTGELADGTADLSDGADQLADGASDLSEGTGELADGSAQLADGTGALADGLDQLATGADALDSGTLGLASGLYDLADGTEDLATGVDGIDTALNGDGSAENPGIVGGAQQLADGLAGSGTAEDPGLVAGADALADGTDELAAGASDLSDGASTYADGVQTAYDGLAQGLAGDGTAENPGIAGGASGLADGATALSSGAAALGTGSQQVADGAAQLSGALDGPLSAEQPAELSSMTDAAATVTEQCTAEGDAALCMQAAQVLAGYSAAVDQGLHGDGTAENPGLVAATQGLATGIAGDGTAENPGIVAGAEQLATGATSLSEGATALSDGLDQAFLGDGSAENPGLVGGADSLADGAEQLSTGTGDLSDGARGLADSLPAVVDGVAQLSDGLGQLGDGASQLSEGAGQLADGSRQSADGASQLSDGAGQLADGTRQSADGASDLADGTSELADGTATLADGATGLADGTRELADGTSELADGAAELDDGAGQLADGSQEMADGLADGADQIPTYTEAERESMSAMGAAPVGSSTTRSNEASGAATATFPFVVALALWLGAFAVFLLLPALSRRLLASAVPMWQVVLRSMLPGLAIVGAQAIAVLAVLTAIGIDPVSPLAVGLITLAGAAMFVAVHQALLAVFGERTGRVLSVLLLVLQVVILTGILPTATAPAALQAISGFMPISIVSQGLVHASLGGTVTSTSATLLTIIAWFAGALAVALVASRGARMLRPSHGKLPVDSRKEPVAA
ncbi:ABC transporter permease [Brachybacterium sp. DNPG3]